MLIDGRQVAESVRQMAILETSDDVRLLLDAGSARDGERSGLASLTARMLAQGAGDWDANEIADAHAPFEAAGFSSVAT